MIKKILQRLFSTHFLSLLMIKMLIPAMATGGMSIEVEANNQLQSACINSITPVDVSVGEAAEICGNSIDRNSEMIACGYRPDIAGTLSSTIRFENSYLLPSARTICTVEQTCLHSYIKLPDLTFT